MRLLQGAKMSERPGHLVSVSFYISFFSGMSAEYFGYITCYRWLFGYANYHFFSSCFTLIVYKVTRIFLTDRTKRQKISRLQSKWTYKAG